MMSGVPLETCWAFNERWNNKFSYKVASCSLFLLNPTTMHWSININIHMYIHTHTHTHTHICIYIYTYEYQLVLLRVADTQIIVFRPWMLWTLWNPPLSPHEMFFLWRPTATAASSFLVLKFPPPPPGIVRYHSTHDQLFALRHLS
jgi:hypothetical protein